MRRVDARVRLAAALAAWTVALVTPHAATAAAVALLALALRLAVAPPARALLAPLAIAAVAALLLVTASEGRAGSAPLLFGRIVAAGWVGSALLSSVSRSELLATLAWGRVPPALLELVATADRQRHALQAFASTVRDAQRLRLGWSGTRRALRSAGALAGLSFCQAVAQAEITSDALALRGARAHPAPALGPVPGWRNAAFAAATALSLLASILLPGVLPT